MLSLNDGKRNLDLNSVFEAVGALKVGALTRRN
jgi:hypothetical protein